MTRVITVIGSREPAPPQSVMSVASVVRPRSRNPPMILSFAARIVIHPPVTIVIGISGQTSVGIIPGTGPSRLVGTEYVGAVNDLVSIDVPTEAVVHLIAPNRYRHVPVKFVVGIVIVGQSAINGSLEYHSPIQIAVVINGTVSRAWGPVECLCRRLLARESHVDVVLLDKEAYRMPNLHPPLRVCRLAGCASLCECQGNRNRFPANNKLGDCRIWLFPRLRRG